MRLPEDLARPTLHALLVTLVRVRLDHLSAVVTGGASGIGAAIAARFRSEGAQVNILDIASGTDISDEQQVAAALAAIDGPIDILVNAAGIALRQPVEQHDAAAWDRLFAVNVRGSFLTAKHVIPRMRARGGGSIIQLGSVVGVTGVRSRAGYSATKGALIALTRNMALDYAADRIRVNCICPGFVRTPLIAPLLADPARAARLTQAHPLGRLGESEDVANAALFLASAEASWITGQTLIVDGGFSAGHPEDY